MADTENERIRKFTVGGLISTVAGTGTGGFSGDGGSATSANLSGPQGVAVDSSGNIYIADYGNSRIREVYASTGNINTIAGNGMPGNSGDGGTPTGAEIYAGNVTVDTSSNIYIGSNMDIRTISASTGLITTIAGNGTIGYSGDGGPATSAELGGGPDGLAVDSSGDVYIADANNAVVREIYETVTSGDNPPASYSPTSALCSEGTLPDDHISNLDGPLSNGYAVMLSLDSNARTSREQCSWGGFPSIVLTAPAVLSFSASTYTSGSGSSASFTVNGYGGNPVGEISPYSGTFTLTIPAGTNIASITIRGTTVCGGGSNSEGELIIGPITIVQ